MRAISYTWIQHCSHSDSECITYSSSTLFALHVQLNSSSVPFVIAHINVCLTLCVNSLKFKSIHVYTVYMHSRDLDSFAFALSTTQMHHKYARLFRCSK